MVWIITVYRSIDEIEDMMDNWVSDDGNKENNKDNNQDKNQENSQEVNKAAAVATLHNLARGKDIALLRALNVGTIIDFMVEMKKRKFGLKYVSFGRDLDQQIFHAHIAASSSSSSSLIPTLFHLTV